ncbi:hypothetical protein OCOJLMKI_3292 [Methylobacterium iners]|uniref:DUF4174 domain-containing protein n=2 Tax=Methylobacterium iners TaxID=418707 RepID=A0ABQ4S2C5_9HYPH|nr:hypothetical protein OCOJLMKI_3292 [Methylobacterium iners]
MIGMAAAGLAASLAAAVGLGGPAQAAGDPLSAYRWKSRLLVISAPTADGNVEAQRRAVAAAREGMAERDLAVVEALGATPEAVALRRRLGLPGDGFRAVLVGKDGEPKITAPSPISTKTLFSTIDAMPMRRDEMRGR